jgi:hypothetical protein
MRDSVLGVLLAPKLVYCAIYAMDQPGIHQLHESLRKTSGHAARF